MTREGLTEERRATRLDEADGHRGRPGTGPRPPADPPGHVTQEYES